MSATELFDVFLLKTFKRPPDGRSPQLLGVFQSKHEAEAAVDRFQNQPEFKDHYFAIELFCVNEDQFDFGKY
jgi:hypothetical protein